VTQAKQGVAGPLRGKEDQEALAGIIVTPRSSPIRRAHSSSSPSPTRKHRRSGVDELKGEMNKIKPPTFDGEHKKEEDVETWLLGMRKYFQLQNYSPHAEGRIAMYQLKGKASMWWDQLVQVQHIKEKILLGKNSRSISKRNT
jgi:hypothetical protein